jgi:hypothetical protein
MVGILFRVVTKMDWRTHVLLAFLFSGDFSGASSAETAASAFSNPLARRLCIIGASGCTDYSSEDIDGIKSYDLLISMTTVNSVIIMHNISTEGPSSGLDRLLRFGRLHCWLREVALGWLSDI